MKQNYFLKSTFAQKEIGNLYKNTTIKAIELQVKDIFTEKYFKRIPGLDDFIDFYQKPENIISNFFNLRKNGKELFQILCSQYNFNIKTDKDNRRQENYSLLSLNTDAKTFIIIQSKIQHVLK